MTDHFNRFTYHETLDALQVAVDRNPGRTNPKATAYGGCLYTYPDGTHCLVGEAFEVLGVPVPKANRASNSTEVDRLYVGEEDETPIQDIFTREAIELLHTAQVLADSFAPWSECLTYAVERTLPQ